MKKYNNRFAYVILFEDIIQANIREIAEQNCEEGKFSHMLQVFKMVSTSINTLA